MAGEAFSQLGATPMTNPMPSTTQPDDRAIADELEAARKTVKGGEALYAPGVVRFAELAMNLHARCEAQAAEIAEVRAMAGRQYDQAVAEVNRTGEAELALQATDRAIATQADRIAVLEGALRLARFRLFGTGPSNDPLCPRMDAALSPAQPQPKEG